MKHREHRPSRNDSPHAAWRRDRAVTPGKRTLTMGLARGAPASAAPLQRKPMSGSAAPARSQGQPVEDWMRVAMRPDLHQTPVLRASGHEVGYAGTEPQDAPAATGGAPMPAAVQAKMEHAFGADLSSVRIHEGPRAQAMGALAYAQGTDIHFAPGQYAPDSRRGQELLGHELTHVVQQAQGRVRATSQASGAPWNADPALEHEADVLGSRAARGERVTAGVGSASAARSAQAPVQARLPERGYTQEVLDGEPEHKDSNLQGLQNLLVRIYHHELSPEHQELLRSSCESSEVNLGLALYRAPSEHTMHAYNWACHLFGHLVSPGSVPPSGPQNEGERNNYQTLVVRVTKVLTWMCGSGSNDVFTSVFGRDHVTAARERAVNALGWVQTHCSGHSHQINVDRTGESEEMMIDGHAKFGGSITLRSHAFAQEPSNDLVASVTHEVFHAANEDVLDNGGYPGAPEDFKQRSPGEKLLNAAHYEEAARRFLGASPVGGDFEPAVRMESTEDGMTEVDTRTPLQRATDRVRNTLQIAWERCQNVHGFLKSHVHQHHVSEEMPETYRAQEFAPILYWSETLHLQIHQRFLDTGSKNLTLHYIDLLQVESLTKTLGRMMGVDLQALLQSTPTGAQQALSLTNEVYENLIVGHLLTLLANRYADARWLTPDRFETMIETLRDAPRDVRQVATT
jgi:hypothetical protein